MSLSHSGFLHQLIKLPRYCTLVADDIPSSPIGSIEANLLPTVVTLAIYFCLADLIIISQTLYYRYINQRKSAVREARCQPSASNGGDSNQPLLSRRRSSANAHNRAYSFAQNDTGLLLPQIAENQNGTMAAAAKNLLSLLAVTLVGCLGWFLAWRLGVWSVTVDGGNNKEMSWVGAFLGYTSAVLYLGARIPQILKNYRNKSCDGTP